jgi:hypothetical protein
MYKGWIENFELEHRATLSTREKRKLINEHRRSKNLNESEW